MDTLLLIKADDLTGKMRSIDDELKGELKMFIRAP
jgi:hypothetical protein